VIPLPLALILTSAVGLTGCGRDANRAAAPDTPSRALVVLLPQAPTTLDPRHATDAVSARAARLIFQPLVDFDAHYQPRPVLADWRSQDPARWRVSLRADRPTFSDATPITAEDVRATYAAVRAPGTTSPLAGSLAGIRHIEVLDDNTLDFHLAAPDPLFPGRLTLGILPARLARQSRPAEAALIGSGPFRIVERVPGGDLLLERRHDGLRVWLRGLQDPLTRLRRIAAGEADIAQGEIGPAMLGWAARQPGLRVLSTPGDTLTYIGLNLRDHRLADPRLRRALALALDRERLAQRLHAGHARPADGLLGPGHWAGGGEATAPRGDAGEARRLFAVLGISPEHPLGLELSTSANPERLRLAAALAAELAPFGVELRIQSADWAAFYAAVRTGRFQTCLLQWVGLKLPDIYRHALHSDSLPPTGANRGGVADPDLDNLIETAEAASPAAAPAAWRAVREHLSATLPFLPLWFEDATAVTGPRVAHYPLGADGSLDGLAEIRLERPDAAPGREAPRTAHAVSQ